MNILFSRDLCRIEHDMLRREWLDTNGCGGYASSTVLNCHTRKYHGLLVANLPAPACGRHVLLSKMEDSLVFGGQEHVLTATQFPGALVPAGGLPLAAFELTTHPSWTFKTGPLEIRRSLALVYGQNSLLTRYVASGVTGDTRLRLKPFLAFRRNHGLARANEAIRGALVSATDGFRIAPYAGMPELYVQVHGASRLEITPAGYWYRDFEYLEEQHRGYDCREDLFLPAVLEFVMTPGQDVVVAVSTTAQTDLDSLWAAEMHRRDSRREAAIEAARRVGPASADVGLAEILLRAADQFLVTTPQGRPALLAGYHWFDDWGRDTMIALPGTAFWTGQAERGFKVLEAFASRERGGRLPNFINPDDTASYNSVDASLWFFWAIQQYLQTGGSPARVQEHLWPVMRRIVEAFSSSRGPAAEVFMDGEGLLHAGTPDTQLTWMDACYDGRPVTPRWGYAVEINALWYNALAFCAEQAREYGDRGFKLPVPLGRLARSFQRKFWLPQRKYLADVVNHAGVDTALRPNQLFAVSLPFSPLPAGMQEAVMECVTASLVTPWGLRTLAPEHPDYQPHYGGNGFARDHAYHQGTVWPWLLGAYVDGYLRVHHGTRAACGFLRERLSHWSQHVRDAGLGSVSEIFDAEPPHNPNGCVAQAWSVGEVLRAHFVIWLAERENSWLLHKQPQG